MAGSPSISIDALLAHSSWLRRLASHLVNDPHQAEDLVQETWAVALENPPHAGIDPRRWLARVLRTRAANRHREKDVRHWHERSASKADEWSPTEVENRVTLQRQLAEAVLALEEPYRTAITLHYFEEMSAEEIALRQRTSSQAVRQHLTRGREKLRARLDREYGNREAWCLVFVELLRKGGAAPVAAGTGKAVALTAVAAALAILSLFVWSRVRSTGVPRNEIAARSAEVDENDRSRDRSEPPIESTPGLREALGGPIRPVDPEREIRGVVFGAGKAPVRGAQIAVFGDDASGYAWDPDAEVARQKVATAESDAQGEFAAKVPPGRPFELEASAEGYATATLGYRYAGERVEIQLGAGAILEGRATRVADGSPVSGARLEITTTDGTLEGERLLLRTGETDEAGRFRFDNLPGISVSVRLTPRSQGAPASRAVTIEPGRTHVVDFAVEDGVTIRGRVLDAETLKPIPNAEVGETWFNRRFGRVDEDGEYIYSGARSPRMGPILLMARAKGYTPTVQMFHESTNIDGGDDLPERYDFHLKRGVRVTGRVLYPDGRPCPDAYVALVSNHPVKNDFSDAVVRIRGRTDDRGRFGLRDAGGDLAFTLLARHDGSGTLVRPCPATSSGAGVVDLHEDVDVGNLVLPEASAVRGSVLDESGRPVPNWTVELNIVEGFLSSESECPLPMPPDMERQLLKRTAKTDDRGRFVFADLAGGNYIVSARDMDTATSCLQRVTAPHGEPLEGVELRLHGSGTIEGRVVNASGQGLSGVGVHTAGNLSGATTDATGSFTLKGLPSDIYDIIIQPKAIPGNVLYLGEQVQGVSSGRKDLIVVLEVATILRGKFVDANDRPIGHGSVIGRVPGRSREFTSYTSADGSFSIPVPVDVSLGLEGFRSPPTEVPDHPMTDENIARAHVLTSSDTEVILRLPR